MRVGVVIPVGEGRRENLTEVMDCLARQTAKDRIAAVCLVYDGSEAMEMKGDYPLRVVGVGRDKHEPGMEQPRNVGVRALKALTRPDLEPISHVWFIDTDIIFEEDCLLKFIEADEYDLREYPGNDEAALEAIEAHNRILVGPYDWLPDGVRAPVQQLYNDPRWVSFNEYPPDATLIDDLSAGLACFSGNLMWPIEEFERVGGFWDDLHHGRCEDGELGLRAVAMGVPIGFVRGARGWHLDHERNFTLMEQRNSRDVPMLNERHPWVQGRCACGHEEDHHYKECTLCGCKEFKKAMFVVEEDGRRFNVSCADCDWTGNSGLIWHHRQECPGR